MPKGDMTGLLQLSLILLNKQKSRAVCREQKDRLYGNARSVFQVLILCCRFWHWACFEKMAFYLLHYVSEQIVMISNICSTLMVRDYLGLPLQHEVVWGCRQSSATYILWYARLAQSWNEWSTGAVHLGLTVFKLQ